MKTFITILLLAFFTTTVYSQAKDTSISFRSDQTAISYSPSGLVSKIFYSLLKFKNGETGIEFSLVTKKREPPPSIKLDSIVLKSYSGKILILNHPIMDTVYYNSNGGLSLTTIHWLDKENQAILKTEAIESIMLFIDNNVLTLKLAKKSHRELTQIAGRLF